MIATITRNNLPKIKDAIYVINFDKYKSIGINWIALYDNDNNATYFDSFGDEHIPKKLENSLEIKMNITTNTTNIYRIQAYDSIM